MYIQSEKITPPAPDWREIEQFVDARVLNCEKDLAKAFELRYRVYCLERGFLNLNDYPDRRERDKYDDWAVHFGIFDKQSNEIIATARLIPIDRRGAPIQEHCIFARGASPRNDGSAAEISRLVLNRHYALNRTNALANELRCDSKPRSWPIQPTKFVTPSLVLVLCRAIYIESKVRGIETWYAAMESSLRRLLCRQLIDFREVGPAVDYLGPVTPYAADLAQVENLVQVANSDMHGFFTDALSTSEPPAISARAGLVGG